jgi:DUF1680 family protein
MPIMLNDKAIASGTPGTYVALDRQWSNGDIIAFTLPMDFRMTKYAGLEQDPKHERYALEYGPILMAYVSMEGRKSNIMLPVSPEKLINSLRAVPDKPLHFTVNENNDFEYMPYLEVQNGSFSCLPLSQ